MSRPVTAAPPCASQPVDPTSQQPVDPTPLLDLDQVAAAFHRQMLAHGATKAAADEGSWWLRHDRARTAADLVDDLERESRRLRTRYQRVATVRTDHADAAASAVVGNVLAACVELAAQAGADPAEAARCYLAAARGLQR